MKKVWVLALFLSWGMAAFSQDKKITPTKITLDFPVTEFMARRSSFFNGYPERMLLLPANTRYRSMDQQSFIQNIDFYYYCGLSNALGCVLVLDGPSKRSILFVPTTMGLLPSIQKNSLVEISEQNKQLLALDTILPLQQFDQFISDRLQLNPVAKFYTVNETSGFRMDNYTIIPDPWIQQFKTKWPSINLVKLYVGLKLQEIKSSLEIDAMRRAAKNGVNAVKSALKTIKPGIMSREVEGSIVKECLCNGGNGVYFWPLVLQGSHASYPNFFSIFSEYRNYDDTLRSGQLLRIDLGCDFNHYKSDVGRTAPVSGKFTAGQREVYDLLVKGYLAGLALFREGTSYKQVMDAFKLEVKKQGPLLKTAEGKKAVEFLLSNIGTSAFQIHEMGLGGTEKPVNILKANMVVAWEPMFTLGKDAYYLEDLIAITLIGYENLTPGLPYFAKDIERMMK
jgi:Xaa-Pro aminopeptidase